MRGLRFTLLLSMLAASACGRTPAPPPEPAYPTGVVTLCAPVDEESSPAKWEHTPVCSKSVKVDVLVTEQGVQEDARTLDETTGRWLSSSERPTYHMVLRTAPGSRAAAGALMAERVGHIVLVVADGTILSLAYVFDGAADTVEINADSPEELQRAFALVTTGKR